jgi:hypothetical protein
MKLSTRSDWFGGGQQDIMFQMQGTWEPCYAPPKPDPFIVSFVIDAFEYRLEAKLEEENNRKNSNVWKSFEHYKRSCSTEFLPSTLRLQSDARVPTPFNSCGSYDIGICKNPLLGWRGYVGGIGQYNPWIALPLMYEPGQLEGDSFVRPPLDLDSLNQRALNNMMPGIKAELSLINSIIELKDFRSLGKSIRGSLDAALSVLKKVKGAASGGTLRKILQSTADGYLQLQFNILPLLKDISAVMHVMSSVDEQIVRLVNGVGKRQTRHFRYVWAEQQMETTQSRGPYFLGPGPNYPGETGAFKWTTRAIAQPTLFNAEIQFNYSLTGWEIAHARLLGFLDALGVNVNPAIIWNAIPWTFVLDWVVGVSSLLNTMKTPNINPTVNITNYCWSVRRQRDLYTQFDYWGYHSPGVGQYPVILPTVHEEAYRRQVGLPSRSSLSLSGLSLTELSLGAALLVARKARSKRWPYPKYPKPKKPKVPKKGH